MHIIYAVTTCSDKVYSQLFADVPTKPAFQSQKYHRLIIEGLAYNAKVDVVANPPVNPSVMNTSFISLPDEVEGGAHYHYVPAIRNSIMKFFWVAIKTFFNVLLLSKKDSVIIVDCLNRITSLSALLAARLSGHRCVGILTDLPDMLGGSSFSKKLANFVIRHCTGYVLMTEAMNEYIHNSSKPYVVLEGQADVNMANFTPSMTKKASPRICLYAGGVSKQYGLENLVLGFSKANIENAQLHIYGPGDYVQELKEISAINPNIFYGGMLLNNEIIPKEMEATLLINPRPTTEPYVKYSFPSKTMEYMASGTPLLTTVLPGMPKDYHPFVFLLHDETAEGIAKTLTSVLEKSDAVLFQQGLAARKFILENKNNVDQAKKILEMLYK